MSLCLDAAMPLSGALLGAGQRGGGLALQPAMDGPYAATSVREFWGRRYNQIVSATLLETVYKPIVQVGVGSRDGGRALWGIEAKLKATWLGCNADVWRRHARSTCVACRVASKVCGPGRIGVPPRVDWAELVVLVRQQATLRALPVRQCLPGMCAEGQCTISPFACMSCSAQGKWVAPAAIAPAPAPTVPAPARPVAGADTPANGNGIGTGSGEGKAAHNGAAAGAGVAVRAGPKAAAPAPGHAGSSSNSNSSGASGRPRTPMPVMLAAMGVSFFISGVMHEICIA